MEPPSHLRLVSEQADELPPSTVEDLEHLERLCRAFQEATGWPLEYQPAAQNQPKANLLWSAPVDPGVGTALGHIRLLSPAAGRGPETRVSAQSATRLAEATHELWHELAATRLALWQREAELAAAVPVTCRREESLHLAAQLEALVRSAAKAVDCQAAGLYLLDEGTTQLKLRASWGLPTRRLVAPARPLRGAVADLEALLGHAVVMTDPTLFDYWRVPEGCSSAACVPVSTGDTPLGTLWVYSDRPRDFNDRQTELLEVVAGRIAAELAQQVLSHEAADTRQAQREFQQLADDASWNSPQQPPRVDGWQVAARSWQGGRVGGALHDWFALPQGGLGVVAGVAREGRLAGLLAATTVRAAVRTCAARSADPAEWLQAASTALWVGSAGQRQAGLVSAAIGEASTVLSLAATLPMQALVVRGEQVERLTSVSARLGESDDLTPAVHRLELGRGDLVLAYGASADSPAVDLGDFVAKLSPAVRLANGQPLDRLLDQLAALSPACDGAILAISRRETCGK